MLNNIGDLKRRLDKKTGQHKEDMCYPQALKGGCEEKFLQCFDGRMVLYPLKQTQAFLELLKADKQKDSTLQHLKQWLIWLKVLVKEKPQHKDIDDWKKSIEMIEGTLQ